MDTAIRFLLLLFVLYMIVERPYQPILNLFSDSPSTPSHDDVYELTKEESDLAGNLLIQYIGNGEFHRTIVLPSGKRLTVEYVNEGQNPKTGKINYQAHLAKPVIIIPSTARLPKDNVNVPARPH